MTVAEYLTGELSPFMADTNVNLDMFLLPSELLNSEYSAANEEAVNKEVVKAIERLMFRPRLEQINENGFSARFSYADLGKYYAWLCKKYGITPDDDVLAASGISMIKDISDRW